MNFKTVAIASIAAAVSIAAIIPVSQAEAGHRHHRDALYAAGGFFGGLIVGNVLAERDHYHGRRYGALPAAHVQSCFDRYNSYHVETNTWTDYNYRTRVCYSPYFY
ncbi:MAG TPA: hypothetical protein VKN63_06290 [Afifellaceae bacterium]|nr:hypothetical protein [Afifellaceae bacterium]